LQGALNKTWYCDGYCRGATVAYRLLVALVLVCGAWGWNAPGDEDGDDTFIVNVNVTDAIERVTDVKVLKSRVLPRRLNLTPRPHEFAAGPRGANLSTRARLIERCQSNC
jgi:hypothetical protein